jgi:MFS superfamily sulfate permease-like transporter
MMLLQAGPKIPDLPVYVDQSIKYTDFLSIVLTALAVLLTALAIAIGIAAIWGYTKIVEEAKRIATRAAERAVETQIRAYFEGPFRDTLKEVVGVPVAPAPAPPGEEAQGTVGKPYPETGGRDK